MRLLVDSIRLLKLSFMESLSTSPDALMCKYCRAHWTSAWLIYYCVQRTGHHEFTEARVVGSVMGRGRWVLVLAVDMDQVLLVWFVLLPFACKGFQELGANG